jgi:hypothetical protein
MKQQKPINSNVTITKVENLIDVNSVRDYIQTLVHCDERFLLLYSGRGIGKTYTVQKTLIQELIDNHTEMGFIVLLDKEEKGKALKGWLDKVCTNEFGTKYEFKVTLKEAFWRPIGTVSGGWTRFAFIFSLACSDSYKLMSFPKMKYLVWDECVKAQARFEDRYAMYNAINLYETIDREQNQLKLICLCNVLKTAKTSPVFDYFHVPPTILVCEQSVYKGRRAIYLPTFITDKEFAQDVLGYEGMTNGAFEDAGLGTILQRNVSKNEKPIQIYGIISSGFFYYLMFTNDKAYLEALGNEENKQMIAMINDGTFFKDNPIQLFTTDLTAITDKCIVIPQQLMVYLQRLLKNGKLKFLNEDTAMRQTTLIMALGITLK